MKPPDISLVIPCHNEQDNLQPLLSAIHAALDPLGLDFEVVITDDCSSDNSWTILKQLSADDRRLHVQRFKFNCGESAASWAGMQIARGRYIATMDADLQNDPRDLTVLWGYLAHCDAAVGWRSRRRDGWVKRLSSRVANAVRRTVTGHAVHDSSCSLRLMRQECIVDLPRFGRHLG